MNDPIALNRELWDAWADAHEEAAFYDVAGFLAGASSLKRIERDAVGDVAGRSLLHLQCHFGLDTLSWARLGARAVGVDFSERAIAIARRLAERSGVHASFVRSRVEELDAALDGTFDIVFTSYGVLSWLPDLRRWAAIVARFLAPGGRFHLIEFHPVFDTFGDDGAPFHYGYFDRGEAVRTEGSGSYAVEDVGRSLVQHTWAHPLSDVVNALLDAGLRIERLTEFDYSPYDLGGGFRERAAGEWVLAGLEERVPIVYAIEASRVSA